MIPAVTGFVGRLREREAIAQGMAAAVAGQGALMLIGGEAGAGKTALLQQALAMAARPGASPAAAAPLMVALSRSAGPGETPLYGPWRELLAHLAAAHAAWQPSPPVAALAGPADYGDGPGWRGPVGTDGYELAAALARDLRALGPLLLAIEDAQWADGASLELLRHLAGRLPRLPVLLLVTYRSSEPAALRPLLPDLQRLGVQRLQLERFTPDEVAELTGVLLPDQPGHPVMARYLHQRTGGHPLFVGELLRAAAQGGGRADGPLPETVQQAIDRQLERLDPAALAVLQVGAVIGERFGYDLLVQASEANEDAVLDALEGALALRLVRSEGAAGDRFAFDHALVREVLLARLIGPRRRRWHLRVADALLAGAAADPELVALHLERAGDPRAATYLLAAGDQALRLGATGQARARYEQALPLLGGAQAERAEALLKLAFVTDDTRAARERCEQALAAAEATGDAAVAVWAQHRQATWAAEEGNPGALALLTAAQASQAARLSDPRYQRLEATLYGEALPYPRVYGPLALALTKAGRLDEAQALVAEMQARTPPGASRTPVLRVQWWMHSLQGRWEDALELGRRLSEACQAEGDDRGAFNVESNRLYHVLLCKADQPAAVDAVAAEMLRLARTVAEVSGHDPLAGGHPPLGWYGYLRGDWAVARTHLLGYLERHPAHADPGIRGFAVMLQLAQGDYAGARATLAAVPPLHPDEDPGLHQVQISAYTTRAGICLAEGDVAGARAWLDAAGRYQQRRGGTAFHANVRLTWARFHQAAGDLAAAHAEANQALTQAQSPREFRSLIAAERLVGELAAALGRTAEADVHLRAAQDLAARCAYPYEVAQAQLVRAELLPATPETAAELAAARATFAELGALPALARAEAALARIPAAGSAPPAAPPLPPASATPDSDGLTARELEVVRLVAQGLSDKEAAAQLFLSPRTVDGHLRRIFAKLSVPSRTALATYAARRGWV